MLWTGALVAAWLAAGAAANCATGCTQTTFRAYTGCLQTCGADVAVTNCDCSATACTRCPGDNTCCQTCCNTQQCVCSNVKCQQPCNNGCCSMCCRPLVEQPQCGNCAPGCRQQGLGCAPCCQPPQPPQPSQPPQTTTTSSTMTTTTTTSRPPQPTNSPNPEPNPPPQPPGQPCVNVSVLPAAPPVVNVSLGNITVNPANITVLPANITFTPHITVVVNTSPVSQVYPYQYAGNVTLNLEQQQVPGLNCTGGRRRCCRVVMAPPYPCPPGSACPPIVRFGCGPQCSSIVQQNMYYLQAPRQPYYYPNYYYRPVYMYVPQTPQYFCSSGCMPLPTWPFARCFDTMPYSAGGMPPLPQYGSFQPGPDAAAVTAPAAATNTQG
ncbi:keratin-associated protein 16-1-like [Schistocerca nitens]|uniref:keratin-associated protein 16-1-like n=1 Tax=Schistocerca nitens TaxID=7011 RepID=UPI0021195171|nr:keratin-associated protein 16-1-like [Schistocerca nitens]